MSGPAAPTVTHDGADRAEQIRAEIGQRTESGTVPFVVLVRAHHGRFTGPPDDPERKAWGDLYPAVRAAFEKEAKIRREGYYGYTRSGLCLDEHHELHWVTRSGKRPNPRAVALLDRCGAVNELALQLLPDPARDAASHTLPSDTKSAGDSIYGVAAQILVAADEYARAVDGAREGMSAALMGTLLAVYREHASTLSDAAAGEAAQRAAEAELAVAVADHLCTCGAHRASTNFNRRLLTALETQARAASNGSAPEAMDELRTAIADFGSSRVNGLGAAEAELAARLDAAEAQIGVVERQVLAAGQRHAQLVYLRGMVVRGVPLLTAVAVVTGIVTWLLGAEIHGLMAAMAAGGVGAIVSVLTRISRGGLRLRVEETPRPVVPWLGAARPVVGAVLGAAVYLLVVGDILPIDDPPAGEENYFYAAMAFIAGFSERWAQDLLAPMQAVPPAPVREAVSSG